LVSRFRRSQCIQFSFCDDSGLRQSMRGICNRRQ
jgi:hypothetical protein